MTQPTGAVQVRGRFGDEQRVYPWPRPPLEPEQQFLSVTSAIAGGLPKPALVGWTAKVTAEYAVDNVDIIKALVDKGDKSGAVALLKGARFGDSTNKAKRGTIVHAAVEAQALGRPLTEPEVDALLEEARVDWRYRKAANGMIQAMTTFFQETDPIILHSEKPVYSREHGYAGTPDIVGLFEIEGERVPAVLDVKTSKRIYDETALQLAAYARAEFVGLDDGTEVPTEKIETGIVVRPMANRKYEVALFDLNDDVYDCFLAALKVTRLAAVLSRSRR